jgi:NADPH2:quinone reductase
MKAWVCNAYGEPSSITYEDWPERTPSAGEVLVRIVAAGVNYPDVLAIAGTYPVKSAPPFIPGIEGAGIVLACGEGMTRIRPGDQVCWQDNEVKASFAETIVLPEKALVMVPEGIDLTVAAACPTVFGTAYFALDHRAGLQPGETLVVHGAAGGGGLAAVAIGKLIGARVVAVGGDDDKLEIVRSCGADHVINYRNGNVREEILALTAGEGADVIFDPVGGDLFDQSMRAIARYGRMIVIGFTSGEFNSVRTNIILIKGISVIGAGYGRYLLLEPEKARADMETLLGHVRDGRLTPRIHARLPIARAPEALEGIVNRRMVGKYVLEN